MDNNEKAEPVLTLNDINAKLDQVIARLMFHETKLDDLLIKQALVETRLNGIMAPKE